MKGSLSVFVALAAAGLSCATSGCGASSAQVSTDSTQGASSTSNDNPNQTTTYPDPTSPLDGTYTITTNLCNGVAAVLELTNATEGTSVATNTVTLEFKDGLMSFSTTYADGCAISQVTGDVSVSGNSIDFIDSSTFTTCNATCTSAECVEDTVARGVTPISYSLLGSTLTLTQTSGCPIAGQTEVMTLAAH